MQRMTKNDRLQSYLTNLRARCANLIQHPKYKKPTAKGRRLRAKKIKLHCRYNWLYVHHLGKQGNIPKWPANRKAKTRGVRN